MKFVVDTSVAVKWFVPEDDHATAVALLETDCAFLAADLLFSEFASALQRKVKLGEISSMMATESCAALPPLFAAVIPTVLLFDRAFQIAAAMNHPVYDCMFLACAERDGLRAIVADLEFLKKASGRGFEHLVIGMDDALAASMQAATAVTLSDERCRALITLSATFERTLAGLTDALTPASDGFRFVPSSMYGPAFDSPAKVRLDRAVSSLSRDQLRDLTALCWLGRGYDGSDWTTLRDRADAMLGNDAASRIPYVLSLLSYLKQGFERIKTADDSSNTTDRAD